MHFYFFFFLMIRRPPRSTLFPTRRSSDLDAPLDMRMDQTAERTAADVVNGYPRSEEHTSELQSRLHLVCRLLLEKKKKKQGRQSLITVHSIVLEAVSLHMTHRLNIVRSWR